MDIMYELGERRLVKPMKHVDQLGIPRHLSCETFAVGTPQRRNQSVAMLTRDLPVLVPVPIVGVLAVPFRCSSPANIQAFDVIDCAIWRCCCRTGRYFCAKVFNAGSLPLCACFWNSATTC